MLTHEIDYWEAFIALTEHIKDKKGEILVIDTETDNKIECLANLFGIGFCFNDDEAFYIPFRKNDKSSWWTQEQEHTIVSWLTNLLINNKLVGHNVLYDILVLYFNWNINFTEYVYSDTILSKHLIDEERPHGLKETSVKYLGAWADKAQQALYENIKHNGGKTTKDNIEMWKADTSVLAEYCCWDTLLCYKLFILFEERLKTEQLDTFFYKDEIMPLYKEVTIPMKLHGFPIDIPYFEELKTNITNEINKLENTIQDEVKELITPFIEETLNKDYPIKGSGSFPKYCAEVINFLLPIVNDKISLSKKEINKLPEPQLDLHINFLNWLKGTEELDKNIGRMTQLYWCRKDTEEENVFNLKSNNHLKWLFFTCLKETPLSFTPSKEPQVDDDFLETIKEKHSWVKLLIDYKKLMKLKSTYIEGILEQQVDGIVRTSMLQFGPPSGRYSSNSPNLQNIPRVKDEDSGLSEIVLHYVNAIKKGFIAGEGKKIVNADYSQLEPRAFAEACGDLLLQQGFINKEDLYGSIAKNVWHLDCTPNEVKKKYPELRQKAKCFVKGAKLDTPNGVVCIEDIKAGDLVRTEQGFKKVIAITERQSETGIFSTNRGFLITTPDHKIHNSEIFVEASQFKEGDKIVNKKAENINKQQYLPVFCNANFKNNKGLPFASMEFNEDWAYILGAWLGDGTGTYQRKTKTEKLGFNSHLISSYVGLCGLSEDCVLEKWQFLVEKYGWNIYKSISKRGVNKPITLLRNSDFEFTKLFQTTFNSFNYDLETKKGNKNLMIQPFVFNSPIEVKLSFIAGLLDTDGYLKHNVRKKTSDVAISSKSPRLMTDLHKLLTDLGVECVSRIDWNKTYLRYYYLLVLTKRGIKTLSELGLQNYLICPRKKEAIEKGKEHSGKVSSQLQFPQFKKYISLNKIQTVYDITVEDVHEFYCDNLRVHNCIALAVVYGGEAYRISQILDVSYDEAQKIIDDYLNAYEGLKSYMDKCNVDVCLNGFVKTKFGRIRHLPEAKELYNKFGYKLLNKRWVKQQGMGELAWKFKNQLNLAKNFPIQGVAASIVNRAMIAINREYKKRNLNAIIVLTIHDEITTIASVEHSKEAASITKECMENTLKLTVPLIAEPLIGDNFAEAK